MNTFNNGLGLFKTKSGGGFREGVGWVILSGGNFVLRGPNPFIKKVLKLSCVQYHMVESSSGPNCLSYHLECVVSCCLHGHLALCVGNDVALNLSHFITNLITSIKTKIYYIKAIVPIKFTRLNMCVRFTHRGGR